MKFFVGNLISKYLLSLRLWWKFRMTLMSGNAKKANGQFSLLTELPRFIIPV